MAKRKKLASPQISPLKESLNRLLALLPEHEQALLLDELKKPLPSAIRFNPLKVDIYRLAKWCQEYGWQIEPVPFCPSGFQITSAHVALGQTVDQALGNYFIQDAASMLPVELFSFNDNEKPLILDLAASPGGKTSHLIANSLDQGFVIANDSSQQRIQALKIVLQTWGGINQAITNFPGEKFGAWFPQIFDKVLLDAPCSMEGLRATEAHPLRPISSRERSSLAHRQVALLESALQAVKVGGEVVYSTCTLTPDEDEDVVDFVLDEFSGRVKLERPLKFNQMPSALLSNRSTKYKPEVEKGIRLWPHNYHTAGFFAAKFIKLATVNHESETPPERSLETMGWHLVKSSKPSQIESNFLSQFGIDLEAILIQFDLSMLGRKTTPLYLFRTGIQFSSAGCLCKPWGWFLAEKLVRDIFLPMNSVPGSSIDSNWEFRPWIKQMSKHGSPVMIYKVLSDQRKVIAFFFRMHQVGSLEEAG